MLADEEPAAPCSPTDELLARFERYLVAERGLAAGAVALYSARARRFVMAFRRIGSCRTWLLVM